MLCELVEEMTGELRHLAGQDHGENIRRLGNEAELCLATAWTAYGQRWMRRDHQRLLRSRERADGVIPQEVEETQSPLATSEWIGYRQALTAVFAALPGGLSVWPELGGLMAQVLSLGDRREQAQILGEVFPIPRLRDVLRTVRDAHPDLSDVDIDLSDRRGYKDVESVQREVKRIRQVILDRLTEAQPTPSGRPAATASDTPAVQQSNPSNPATPEGVANPPIPAPEPVCASALVRLYGPGEKPIVNGKSKPLLSRAQYKVVCALIQAGQDGLTKDKLDKKSGCGDARKTMRRLADSDPDWKQVLLFPGKPGVGYRIR